MLPVSLDAAIFRAYDVRGIVGETLTEENVFLIGQAFGLLVKEQDEKQVALARDGRHSGPVLMRAVAAGMRSVGIHVVEIGMVPTPVLYYATHCIEGHSGVMVTGSHNPSHYNGLKMVVKGKTLAEQDIKSLYQRIVAQRMAETGEGTETVCHEMEARYIEAVMGDIHLARPLRIVVDAGNGVAGQIAPALYRALGCTVHELYCEVDGGFPHHHPDPSQAENLRDLIHAVRAQEADIGLAFDGDGDRLGVVTSKGTVIWPDRLLMLFAQAILQQQPGAKIIYDVKCSSHLATLIRTLGGEPLMWKTGHSLIKAKLTETQAPLAGEMSGHFFFNDRWYGFDDALYAGARLLERLAVQSASSDELFATIPNSTNTPELKVLVAEEEKFQLMQQLIEQAHFPGAEITLIDGLRVNFADGWGLIRPSNTTPYLILRFEAINEAVLQHIQHLFRHWMQSVRTDWVLPF